MDPRQDLDQLEGVMKIGVQASPRSTGSGATRNHLPGELRKARLYASLSGSRERAHYVDGQASTPYFPDPLVP